MRQVAILICRFADLVSTCLDVFHRATSLHAFLRLPRRSHFRLLWGDHKSNHLFHVQIPSSQYISTITFALTKTFHVYGFRWTCHYRLSIDAIAGQPDR